jgi:hypothetical protein
MEDPQKMLDRFPGKSDDNWGFPFLLRTPPYGAHHMGYLLRCCLEKPLVDEQIENWKITLFHR